MKLYINNKTKFGKFINICKLKNTLLNNEKIREEITREIRKYFQISEEMQSWFNIGKSTYNAYY